MNDKDIILKLNSLKNIKPSEEWKDSNRSVLLSQISGGIEGKESIFTFFYGFKRFLQPAFVPVYVVLFFLIGGFASWRASSDAKPGDSLYIAKIISEKTQLAVTFDDKNKAKLNIEFAHKRLQEIEDIVSKAEEKKVEFDQEKTDKLSSDFKKEINSAKSRLEKNVKISTVNEKKNNPVITEKTTVSSSDNLIKEENSRFFTATLKKDDKGLDISLKDDISLVQPKIEPVVDSEKKEDEKKPTSSIDISNNNEEVNLDKKEDPKKILEEAEKLFENNDFAGVKEKLEKANEIINK